MKPIDWLLIGALAVILAGIVTHLIIKKKKGKGGCGCGCGCGCQNCPSAGGCGGKSNTEEENV